MEADEVAEMKDEAEEADDENEVDLDFDAFDDLDQDYEHAAAAENYKEVMSSVKEFNEPELP
jgi:hypothetical protein